MRVTAPVTDYIRASVLPSKGDMVVRGDLVPENLAAGAFNTFLRGQGVGELPAYDNLGEADGSFLKGKGAGVAPAFEILDGVLDAYLKAQGDGNNPIFEKLTLRDTGVKIGSFTIDGTGTASITGVGYTSSVVIFLASDNAVALMRASWGFDDATAHLCTYQIDETGNVLYRSGESVRLHHDVSNYLCGYISAMNSDGFSFSHTEVGGISEARVIYLAFP